MLGSPSFSGIWRGQESIQKRSRNTAIGRHRASHGTQWKALLDTLALAVFKVSTPNICGMVSQDGEPILLGWRLLSEPKR